MGTATGPKRAGLHGKRRNRDTVTPWMTVATQMIRVANPAGRISGATPYQMQDPALTARVMRYQYECRPAPGNETIVAPLPEILPPREFAAFEPELYRSVLMQYHQDRSPWSGWRLCCSGAAQDCGAIAIAENCAGAAARAAPPAPIRHSPSAFIAICITTSATPRRTSSSPASASGSASGHPSPVIGPSRLTGEVPQLHRSPSPIC